MARTKGFSINLEPLLRFYGKDQVIQKFVEEVGPKDLIPHLSVDKILTGLTPAQRKELTKRLRELTKQ